MKCFKKSLFAVLCFFFSLLFSISSSIPTHAIDLNPGNLDLVGWNSNPCSRLAYTVGTYIEGFSDWSRAPRYDHHKVVGYVRIGGCGETMWTVKGSFVQIIFSLSSHLASDIPTIIYPQKNGDFEPISHRVTSSVDTVTGHIRTFEIIGKYVGVNTPSDFVIAGPSANSPLPLFAISGSQSNTFVVHSVTSWVQRGNSTESVTNELKNVGNKISEVAVNTNSSSQKINETLETIKKNHEESIVAQNNNTNAINKQTEQQKNQHDQDKKEEKDRENKGNDQSSKLSNLFSFTAFNPFSGLFGLFTGSGCKPIPTIGKLLNKPDATYCPWFPDNVRSILTPVIGISSMMLIFGFFIRWLSGSSMNGIIKAVERY